MKYLNISFDLWCHSLTFQDQSNRKTLFESILSDQLWLSRCFYFRSIDYDRSSPLIHASYRLQRCFLVRVIQKDWSVVAEKKKQQSSFDKRLHDARDSGRIQRLIRARSCPVVISLSCRYHLKLDNITIQPLARRDWLFRQDYLVTEYFRSKLIVHLLQRRKDSY